MRSVQKSLVVLSLAVGLVAPAAAQVGNIGGFYGDHDLRTNLSIDLLQLQVQPGTTDGVTGNVAGRSITGYYASGSNQAVWIEMTSGRMSRAYVATVTRKSMSGVMYALHSADGGTDTRNTYAFVSTPRSAIGLSPLVPSTPLVELPVPGPAIVPSTSGAWITANGYPSILNLQIASSGNVTGTVFGDQIRGHFAQQAGIIAFVRLSGGVPIQFFQGTYTGNYEPTLAGTFYALSPAAGASPTNMSFMMSATAARRFVAYSANYPSGGPCLTIAGGVPIEGRPLVLTSGCALVGQHMAIVTGPNNANYVVNRDSGLCLGIAGASIASGAAIQQFTCTGAVNQQIQIVPVVQHVTFKFVLSGLCLTQGARIAGSNPFADVVEQQVCAGLPLVQQVFRSVL